MKGVSMTQDNDEQSGENRRKVAKTKLYKVAKTLLSRKPEPEQDMPQAAPPPDEPKTRVANVRAQFEVRESERIQQEIATRQAEAPKQIEPIEAEKKVKSCPFGWTEVGGKQRLNHCTQCQAPIYYLEGMELEEARGLIRRREGRKKVVLYSRPDGKFMTTDCPVAQKKRLQIVGLAVAIGFCMIAAVAAFIMMPPAPPPTATSTPEASAPETSVPETTVTTTPAESSSSARSSDGATTHHYEAGDPMPPVTPAAPYKTKAETSFSEQEQKGEFWVFPNGQPADDFGRNPGAATPATPSGQ
jgi:hypothetical protein